MTFSEFLAKIAGINRAPWNGQKAPHKPVLLLAVADWFEEHSPTEPLVPVDEELLRLFKENWGLLVGEGSYKEELIARPFYHLKTDGIWQPMYDRGALEENKLRTEKQLVKGNAYAILPLDIYQFFQNPVDRELIRMMLLDTFFPYTKHIYIERKGLDGLILDIEADMLKEPSNTPRYARRVVGMKEKEGFIRDHKFRPLVLRIYDYRCCISNLWVKGTTLVQACHIMQHADFGIDRLDNGLALCPNLHDAFDAGVFSLSDDYHVILKKNHVESDSPYGLRQFEGKKIRLPKEEKYWPGKEWVAWHREYFEFK